MTTSDLLHMERPETGNSAPQYKLPGSTDPRATLDAALRKLDPTTIKHFSERPGAADALINVIHDEHEHRFALIRERDELSITLASKRDQHRGLEAKIRKPAKGRSDFETLKVTDDAIAERDRIAGEIRGLEETIAYITSQIG